MMLENLVTNNNSYHKHQEYTLLEEVAILTKIFDEISIRK